MRLTTIRLATAALCVCVTFTAAGCGKSSKPKAEAQPAAADAEQKAEQPAEKAPAPAAEKPAQVKPAPIARRRPQDPMKWEVVDLQSGLAAHDGRFVPAVMFFSIQNPNGAKQANELRTLLERAGQLKDDAMITLPLAPAPITSTAAKPVVQGPAPVTPPAGATPTPPGSRGNRRGGRTFGFGR